MWFISASILRKPLAIRILGVAEGLWIGLYTFFGNVFPITVLAPASVISVVWYPCLQVFDNTSGGKLIYNEN
jgi:hypothetical protein